MSPAFVLVLVVAALAFWIGASWLLYNQRRALLKQWTNLR